MENGGSTHGQTRDVIEQGRLAEGEGTYLQVLSQAKEARQDMAKTMKKVAVYRDAAESAASLLKATLTLEAASLDKVSPGAKSLGFSQIKSGIVASHKDKLMHLAEKEQTIISIRPVELSATGLIESKNYQGPTKGFRIKGKSSNWGPMAGCIAVDQKAWSKLAGQARAESYTQSVLQCIQDGYAIKIPLVLSKDRLKELESIGYISGFQGGGKNVDITAKSPDGEMVTFSCEALGDGRFGIASGGKPVEVLGQNVGGETLPITADYDLFALGPKLYSFGSEDMSKIKQVDHAKFIKENKKRLERIEREGIQDELDALIVKRARNFGAYFEAEDQNKGNVSPRVLTFIDEINEALGRAAGLEVVHHNQDASSLATDMAANFPVSVFAPKDLLHSPEMQAFKANQALLNYYQDEEQDLIYLQDESELAKFILIAKGLDYYFPVNDLWSDEVKRVLRPSFTKAMDFWKGLTDNAS